MSQQAKLALYDHVLHQVIPWDCTAAKNAYRSLATAFVTLLTDILLGQYVLSMSVQHVPLDLVQLPSDLFPLVSGPNEESALILLVEEYEICL